jgi:hypothetical protein
VRILNYSNWRQLPYSKRTIIVCGLGGVFGFYWLLIFGICNGFGHAKNQEDLEFFGNLLYGVGLGPIPFGHVLIFYLGYTRRFLYLTMYVAIAVAASAYVSGYSESHSLNFENAISIFLRITDSSVQRIITLVPAAVYFSVLGYWLVNPSRP